jgi:hypothetical protein
MAWVRATARRSAPLDSLKLLVNEAVRSEDLAKVRPRKYGNIAAIATVTIDR